MLALPTDCWRLCRRELNTSVKELFKSRLRIRALEDEVEKPMNVHRWRALEVQQLRSDRTDRSHLSSSQLIV